ncbi:hypothetical protein [Hymenobacter terricola]|nr:hypothetical protein [Hymenobacter terricola]
MVQRALFYPLFLVVSAVRAQAPGSQLVTAMKKQIPGEKAV